MGDHNVLGDIYSCHYGYVRMCSYGYMYCICTLLHHCITSPLKVALLFLFCKYRVTYRLMQLELTEELLLLCLLRKINVPNKSASIVLFASDCCYRSIAVPFVYLLRMNALDGHKATLYTTL